MLRSFAAAAVLLTATTAQAVEPFPAGFKTQEIATTGGAVLHVRVGGSGPAVVLLHGFADTGDMWAPIAQVLVKDHTVIVPDLRGMGLSNHPSGGYDKKTQAQDIAQIMDTFHVEQAQLVTHDIGNMVGYSLAAQFPARVTKWAVMDAPLPGLGTWDEQIRNPLVWHFNFRGPDVERLVAGRERIYLDRFYNELSATPASITNATRDHYAKLYARPGAMHAAFEQFHAFGQDAVDNRVLSAKGALSMPVLAIGGDHSYGLQMAKELKTVADNVTGVSIPNAGHWLMEEQPVATTRAVVDFLEQP